MNVPLPSNAELATEVQRLRTRVAELESALATKMGETAPTLTALPDDTALALIQFDALIDTLPVGIGFLDPELRYVRVNPALATLNGLTPTEHLGHTLGALFPKLAAQIEPTLRRILATGEVVRDLELRARFAPGVGLPHDWLMNAYPVRGPDNTVIGIGVATTDVTPFKQGYASLQAAYAQTEASTRLATEHVARIESLLAHAPIGIALLDTELRYQHINAHMATINKRTPADHLGRTIREVLPSIAAELEARFGQVLATGEPLLNLEATYAYPSEPTVSYSWQTSYFPVRDAAGGLVGVGAVMLDITARRQAEQALSAEHQQLTAIVNTLHEGVIAVRPDGAIVLINPAALHMCDLDLAHPPVRLADLGRTPQRLCDNGSQALAPEEWPLQRVLRGERFVGLELCVRSIRDDQVRWLVFNGTPVYAEDGTLTLGVVTIQDITARKADEAALHAAQAQAAASAQTAVAHAARLDSLLTHAPVGISLLDTTLRFQQINPALAKINGLPPEAHLGRLLSEVLPLLGAEIEAMYHHILATGEPLFDIETVGETPAAPGVRRVWQSSYFPVRDNAGTLIGAGGVVTDITERLRADQVLRDTERKLGTLFALLPVGISIFTAEDELVYVNPALEQILRMDRAGLFAGAHLARPYIRPDRTPRPLEDLVRHRVFREHTAIMNQINGFITEAGEEVWVNVSGVPVDFPDWQVVIVTSDITQRKQAEDALRASEARYRTLFETMAQGVIVYDATGCATIVNPAAQRILGLSREAIISHGVLSLGASIIRQDGTPVSGNMDLALTLTVLQTGHEVRDVVIGVTMPGAAQRWLRIQAVPQVPSGMTAPTHVYVIFEDITAQWQAQRTLEHERQQLNAIVQTMYEGVIAFHPDGTIAVINAAGLHLCGLDSRMDPPTTLGEIYQAMTLWAYNEDGQRLLLDDWPVQRVRRGEPVMGIELCLHAPVANAPEYWLTFSGTPVYDEQGTLILGVITYQDITQRKQAEAALRARSEALSRANTQLSRALKLKDEFLAMMSHELRTPLTAILGISEAMVGADLYGALNEQQRGGLTTVIQSGRHLLALVADILDLAHLESGTATLQQELVDVEMLCLTTLEFVQTAAQAKHLQLLRTLAHGIRGVRADMRRLTQILVNLLDNAIKFTPEGGTVGLEVTVNREQEYIRFVVWDTGIGIAQGDYGRLFEPFTQGDGRLVRQYGGIGLGLSLVRRLVELHGGSVSLASTLGQGSRFTVSLPWIDSDNVVARALPGPLIQSPVWIRPLRVVIADDHEPTLRFYRDLLSQQGCEVVLARTGMEAVAQVRATRPNVVVLDIQMPELDGLTALQQIRADPEVGATPIIALTALAMPDDRERCLEAGATAYFTKPVSLHTLMTIITEVLPPLPDDPADAQRRDSDS